MKQLLAQLAKSTLTPIAQRVGIGLAGYLMAQGVPDELTDQLVHYLGIVGALGLDVVLLIATKGRYTR